MRIRSIVMYVVMPAGVLGSLNGCALYSETRDRQGQEAAKAWQQVDLAAQVAVPRKNMAALLSQQLDLADEFARARRDSFARSIAAGGKLGDSLIDPVNKDLAALAGSVDIANGWRAAREAESSARRTLAETQRGLRWLGVEVPDCAALAGSGFKDLIARFPATPAQSDILSASVIGMTEACAEPDLGARARVPLAGAMGTTRDTLMEAASTLAAQRAAGLQYRNSYRAALAEYDAAVAALNRSPNEYRDKVADAAGKLRIAADALARLDDAFSIRFLSEQKRDALNETLATILDRPEDGGLPKDASRATVALAVFPDLLDTARLAFADARKPSLVPLLLQKNLEQIKADAASRDVKAQLATISTLEQLLEAQSRHADRLLRARAALDGAARGDSASEALGSGNLPIEKRMALWRATAFYLDGSGRVQAEAQKARYKLYALDQERALAYAESNMLQWKTLIDSNVAQMAEFGASGIKAAHVTALLNSASLLAIAIGTN